MVACKDPPRLRQLWVRGCEGTVEDRPGTINDKLAKCVARSATEGGHTSEQSSRGARQ